MKQIFQDLKNGNTELFDVPAPMCRPGQLVIATSRSLISAGTERMLVEFGQANLLAKARAQPEKVLQVLEKIRTDGLLPTMETVFARLDQPLPLGYCNAGVVLEVGEGVTGFSVGDRVVSNGSHAEIVSVPKNLCALIPDGVSNDQAAFTVLGAIGLQSIRLVNPTLGEKVVVIGLGLVGLMVVQMLVANGCQVLGIDFESRKLDLARQFGAQIVDLSAGADPVVAGLAFSNGHGVDAVVIAAATKGSDPVRQAAQMSRKRGRLVLVGVTGLELNRADFYEKELTFQVSCSYGPGRYDENYENRGQDYPFGFIRWTEQRNFEAVLGLLADRKLDLKSLISRRIPQIQALQAYQALLDDRSLLGVLLTYPEKGVGQSHTIAYRSSASAPVDDVVVGMIGAGNFASLVLIPALKKIPAYLKTVASGNDGTGALAARKFGFQKATTDYQTILADSQINTVFIATRHNTHARMVVESLQAGKHVFVEKPLALDRDELAQVRDALENSKECNLFVGFNRRFSSLAQEMKRSLAARAQPLSLIYTVNAGAIPADHWTQDPQIGGGRIIGEGCHFIDFLRFLVDAPIVGLEARMVGDMTGIRVRQDKMMITLEFSDSSLGAIHYLANGSKSFPKERVEVFSEGRILVLDNFKTLNGYGWRNFKRKRLWRQDKGHASEVNAFVERIRMGGDMLIPWTILEEVTLATFNAVERAGQAAKPLA